MAAPDITDITQHIRQVIETELRAKWITSPGVLRTPIQFPNVTGLVNVDGSILTEPPTQAAWLKLDISWGDSTPRTIGVEALNQLDGVIFLTLFVPAGIGMGLMETLKGHARKIFTRYHGGLQTPTNFLRCRATDGGSSVQRDGAWVYSVMATAFYTHERVTLP